jgi:hypothetical protein
MARLNQKDSGILKTGKDIDFLSPEYAYFNGEFGNDQNDYVEVLIYDEQENFLESGVVDEDDYVIENSSVKLKTGNILRKVGYDRGRYVVKYNFLRKVAGSYENLLVDKNDIRYEGEFILNDDGTIVDSDGEELFVKENKYVIQEISPSRKEIRLMTQNIRNKKYLSDFFNLQRNKKLISSEKLELGPVEFYINEGLLPEKKQYSHFIQLPISATSNMVGGYIYLNDAYIAFGDLGFEEPSFEDELDALYEEQTDTDYGGS